MVGIVFSDLLACRDMDLNLFEEPAANTRLAETVDGLNARLGKTLALASIASSDYTVPDRIPFGAPEGTL